LSLYLTVTVEGWCVGRNPPKLVLSPQFPFFSLFSSQETKIDYQNRIIVKENWIFTTHNYFAYIGAGLGFEPPNQAEMSSAKSLFL